MDRLDSFVVADQAWLPPAPPQGGGDDVALLHLPTPLHMNGTTSGYAFAGFVEDESSLLGTTVTCKGYGHNAMMRVGIRSALGPCESACRESRPSIL